jgi:hypothetical protein
MNQRWLLLGVLWVMSSVLLLGCSPVPQPIRGSYVGRVDGTEAFIAIVTNGTNVGVYVCDGMPQEVEAAAETVHLYWFKGTIRNNAIDLTSQSGDVQVTAQPTADGFTGGVRLKDGRTLSFTASEASGDSGLFAFRQTINGVKVTAGWIVMPQSRHTRGVNVQRGAVKLEFGDGSVKFSNSLLDIATKTATISDVESVTAEKVTPAAIQRGGTESWGSWGAMSSDSRFGTSGFDQATGLAKHSSGVYVVGSTGGDLDGTSQGSSDGFIRKYSSTGSILWARQFGSFGADVATAVATDTSDNAYVVGHVFDDEDHLGSSDAFVGRFSADGSTSWRKKLADTSSSEGATGVAVAGSYFYVVGFATGSLAGSLGGGDAFIRKYTSGGVVVWTRQFGTSRRDGATGVAVDGSGNVYVAGFTSGALTGTNSDGDIDMFIRRYSSTGGVVWTRQVDGATSVAVAASGSNVHLVGSSNFTDEVRVVKYTALGSVVWDRLRRDHRRDDIVLDASVDPSGNLYVSGVFTTDPASVPGSYDGYVRKLDANGSTVWNRAIQTSAADYANAVVARSSSEVYAAGTTHGLLGTANSGNGDAFLRRLNGTTGDTVWTDQ